MTRLLSTQPTPSPWLVSCCSSCGYELSSLHTTGRQRVKVCVRARKEPTQREKDRWGSAKIPFTFMSCRIPCASPLCALARLRIFAFSHVAGLFALFGESATNLDWGNMPRHNLSCAYLAPVALSVRLVFFTKH